MRIPSATLSLSANVPPPSQAVSSGSSFRAVLAHASTENDPEPQATSDAAMSSVRARADNSSAGWVDTKLTNLAGPEGGAVADLGAGQAQPIVDATEADTSAGVESAPTDAVTGTTSSAAGQTSSDAYFRQAMVGSLATDAGFESSSIHEGDVPAANTATSGLSTKQDRSKAQTEVKKAAAAVAVPAVADPGRLPAVNIVSLPGTAHGQESGSSENPGKNAAAESSAATHGKTADPIDGPGVGDTGAAPLSSSAAVDPQGILVQLPAQPSEAGMDLSMASGLLADSELTHTADMGLPAVNPMGTGAATTDQASSKAIDGASNTKSVTTGTDAAWHAANDSQTAQSLQAEASKTGAGIGISRAVENAAVQTTLQTVLTPTSSPESATAQRATAGVPDSAHAGKAQDLPASAHLLAGEGTPASGINSAKLIQTMGETEMHVGMHSAEFGDISIRTSLSQQQMVTQISLNHSDLSQTISSHLSSVQAKLGEEYGLHASIEVNNQGAPLSGGQGNSPQRDQPSHGRSSSGGSVVPAEVSDSVSSVVALANAGSGHGLDITV